MTEPSNGRAEFLMDLDAFAPPAGRRVKFRDTLYTIRNFNDMPIEDALTILRVRDDMAGKATAEQLQLSLQYVRILIPEMDQGTAAQLSSSQILQIMSLATEAAEVPPVAGAAPSGSPSSSPASAVSTDGAGGISAS